MHPNPALEAIGMLPDSEIDIAGAAVQLARIRAPDADVAAAQAHLSGLARESARIGEVLRGRPVEARIGALAGLIHARHGYAGDSATYDDLDNANLIRVIERRRGLPVALGILWLHCIRAAGWEGSGVDTPGHFLLRMDGDPRPASPGAADGAERAARRSRPARRPVVLIDAFAAGAVVGPDDLAALVRGATGQEAELGPGVVRPVSNRSVLLRLQRNGAQRLAAAQDFEGALGMVSGMIAIAPEDPGLWREAALLNQQLSRPDRAIDCLERFLDLIPPRGEAARGARARIDQLRAGRT